MLNFIVTRDLKHRYNRVIPAVLWAEWLVFFVGGGGGWTLGQIQYTTDKELACGFVDGSAAF
jgi:hypothetical protein